MTPSILAAIEIAFQRRKVGRVLDYGAYNYNGSVRNVLESRSTQYLGVDIEYGPGVDVVISHHSQVFEYGMFDTVICCETLEHTIDPFGIVSSLRQIVVPGGYLCITTPTYGFPEHRYPIDCYRFGTDIYAHGFFKDWHILELETLHSPEEHPIIFCLGSCPAFF